MKSDVAIRPSTNRLDRVLHIIQRQTTIQITSVIRPRNTKSHTLQPTPLPAERRSIHLEILNVMSRVQLWKKNGALDDLAGRFPAPDADCAFGLRYARYTCV